MDPKFFEYVNDKFDEPGAALDLGCGDGADMKALIDLGWKCDGGDLKTGIDLNYVYSSPGAPYDLVYSNYVIQKLTNSPALVETITNNLKKGGKFFVQTFHVSDQVANNKFTEEQLSKLFDNGSLEVARIKKYQVYDDEPGHEHFHQILQIYGSRPL